MSAFQHPDTAKLLEYRALAVQAAERAMQARDPDLRKSWDHIAQSYHKMAEWLEKGIGPGADPRPPSYRDPPELGRKP
jgi:hypothetical protein